VDDWILLSKALPHLVYPSTVVLLLFGVAYGLLLVGRRRWVIIFMSLAFSIIVLGSLPMVSSIYQKHERLYPPVSMAETSEADAIVLLGGDVSIPAPPRVETQVRGNRVIHAMRLYHAGKAPFVIITGGNIFPQEGLQSEAEYTASLLEELGVPRDAIIIEGTSRNTRENSIEIARILTEQSLDHILLVTDAFHMPRALATFRTLGVNVTPSTASISAELQQPELLDWIPSLDGLNTLKSVIHENLGIVVYRARGWID